jgi:hypothetical protein
MGSFSLRLPLIWGLASALSAKEVTFHKDVLPILQKRCQECHRQGEVAPMKFTSYKEARPWAKAIKEAVVTRRMPPWHADPHYGKFANDRSLSQNEIDTLTAWADTGAKEGPLKDAPSPVSFVDGWTIGKPDVVIQMPIAYKVPATGTVEYTYFVVPSGFKEDRWIDKLEARAGSNVVVHHIVVYARAPGRKFLPDAKPGEPFVPKKSPTSDHPADTGTGELYGLGDGLEMVAVYVPGGTAYQTRPGQARLIPAGADLIFQMHYTPNGKETLDQSRLGIVFAKEPPKERVVNTFIMNPNMRIPAGESNAKVDARVTLKQDVVLQSFFPHMHVRGKAFEYRAVYPSGESQVLMRVPKYDFNWQMSYYLQEPLLLPKGTRIEASAWYDNSPNNPSNPNPKEDVYWGDQTWEEMLAGFMDFAIPVGMTPSEIIRAKKPQTQAALQ